MLHLRVPALGPLAQLACKAAALDQPVSSSMVQTEAWCRRKHPTSEHAWSTRDRTSGRAMLLSKAEHVQVTLARCKGQSVSALQAETSVYRQAGIACSLASRQHAGRGSAYLKRSNAISWLSKSRPHRS